MASNAAYHHSIRNLPRVHRASADGLKNTKVPISVGKDVLELVAQIIDSSVIPDEQVDIPNPSTIKKSRTSGVIYLVDSNITDKNALRLQIMSRMLSTYIADINMEIFISIYLSTLSLVFSFIDEKTMNPILSSAGYDIQMVPFEYLNSRIKKTCLELARISKDEAERAEEEGNIMIGKVCTGMLLLISGKTLNQNNYQKWDGSRWASLLNTTGAQDSQMLVTSYFNETYSKKVDSLFSMCKTLRAHLFVNMMGDKASNYVSVFKLVLNNLRWYQMTNFWLVTETLGSGHVYMFLCGEVSILLPDFRTALKFASTLKNLPWCKYIRSDIPASVFNSNSIQLLAEISKIIAIEYGQESYNNYITGYRGLIDRDFIKKVVQCAKRCSYAWAEYIRCNILPAIPENDKMAQLLYDGGSGSYADGTPLLNAVEEHS